ncbi:MAG: pyridoxamine 5'-phosphate oxidase family protein [Pyrinomonadaceae bacterium]
MSNNLAATSRTKLKRYPKRGNFDRETIYKILDEAFICHIGFSVDGQTFVIPTAYGRKGDALHVHGSAASRMMSEMSKGIDVCITVTMQKLKDVKETGVGFAWRIGEDPKGRKIYHHGEASAGGRTFLPVYPE